MTIWLGTTPERHFAPGSFFSRRIVGASRDGRRRRRVNTPITAIRVAGDIGFSSARREGESKLHTGCCTPSLEL